MMRLRETKTILIADDSEFFRTRASDILIHAGYKVRFARDGGEVVKELKSNLSEIDLLMLDLQMPRISGFDVLAWIRENNLEGKLPVLAITGAYEATNILKKVRDLGATGLVTKAATVEQLLFRVNNILFKDRQKLRCAERVPTTIAVDFTTGNGAVCTGFMINLSKTGCFIYTKEGVMPGDFTHLRFSIPGHNNIIEVDSDVVWKNRLGEGKDNLFKGIGINFTKIDPEDQKLIELFVEEEMERLE